MYIVYSVYSMYSNLKIANKESMESRYYPFSQTFFADIWTSLESSDSYQS